MAGKLNTRFLLIVGSVVATLGIVVGGLAYMAIKADATRHIRAAEQYEAEGKFDLAKAAWARAIGKDPTNVDYWNGYERILLTETPATIDEARESLANLQESREKKAQASRGNFELAKDFVDLRLQIARISPTDGDWQRVQTAAEQFVIDFPEGSAERRELESIELFALARRAEVLNSTERARALERIEALLASDPASQRVNEAFGLVLAAKINEELANGGLGTARATIDRYVAHLDGLSPELRSNAFIAQTELLTLRRLEERGVAVAADIEALRERVVSNARIDAPDHEVVQIAQTGFGNAEQRAFAVSYLEDVIEDRPDAILPRVGLSRILRYTDPTRSLDMSQKVIDLPPRTVGPLALFLMVERSRQALQIVTVVFELGYEAAQEAENGVAPPPFDRAALEQARAQLATFVPDADDDRLAQADALVAILADEPTRARAIFERLFETGSRANDNADTRRFAALAAINSGELGEALRHTEEGLRAFSSDLRLRVMQVSLLANIGRFEEAESILGAIETLNPDSTSVRELADLIDRLRNDASERVVSDGDEITAIAQRIFDLTSQREFDDARALAAQLNSDFPDDVRSWRVRSQVLLLADDRESSNQMAIAGLERFPDDAFLQSLRAMSETDDRVDTTLRLAQLIDDNRVGGPNPTLLRANELAGLLQVSVSTERTDPDVSARALSEAEPRIEPFLNDLPDDPSAILGVFEGLQRAGRDDDVARLVAKVREIDGDPAFPALLDARASLLQGDAEKAVAVVAAADEQRIRSADLDRLKGIALRQLGRTSESVEAFRSAWERDPRDLLNILLYCGSLRERGQGEEALGILRNARRAVSVDPRIQEMWLGLETQIGDQRAAFETRLARFRADPRDVQNSLQLADQLVNGPVGRLDVLDRNDRVRFSPPEWNQLDGAERTGLLADARERRRSTAISVLDNLVVTENPRIAVPGLLAKARVLEGLSRDDEARVALETLRTQYADDLSSRDWVEMGATAHATDDLTLAGEMFTKAREEQIDVEVDRALSEFWRTVNELERALAAAIRVTEHERSDGVDRLRVARLTAANGRLDESLEMLEQLPAAVREGYDGRMFAADLALDRASAAIRIGDTAARDRAIGEAREELREAAKLAPDNSDPLVREVLALQMQAGGDPQSPAFVEAEGIATRAVEMRPGAWGGVRRLTEVLIARRKMQEAVGTLRGFVEAYPRIVEARRMLAALFLQVGQPSLAFDTLEDAIALGGDPAPWYLQMAELHLRRGDIDSARDTAKLGFEARPDIETMRAYVNALTAGRDADFAAIARLFGRFDTLTRNDPVAQAANAAFQASRNQMERSEVTWRRAWGLVEDPEDYGLVASYLPRIHPPARAERGLALLESVDVSVAPWRAWQELARLFAQRGETGADKALELYERADQTATAAGDRDARGQVAFEVGSVLYAIDDCEGALAAFEQSLEFRPDQPSILNNVAFLRAKCLDDSEGALEAALAATSLVPRNPSYLDTLGFIQMRLGRLDEAVRTLRDSVANGRSAANSLHLAEALIESGQTAEAGRELTELERAVQRGEIVMTDTHREDLAKLRGRLG